MQPDELTAEGARHMSVCNACRYCEQYCPVFQAMEQRVHFASADLNYLANLCHSCGECLYACQYAPPHEFAINVPMTLSRIRVRSYEAYAWPARFGAVFRHHNVPTALLLAAVSIAVMLTAAWAGNPAALRDSGTSADFYSVVPHSVMAGLFGAAGLFVLVALSIGVARCWHDIETADVRVETAGVSVETAGVSVETAGARVEPAGVTSAPDRRRRLGRTLRDVLTLRHLHSNGADCVTAPEVRAPWRRRFHHATFYGFALCFASTSVAALYHFIGWQAPYAYTSLPVLLGTLGGIGLVIGPAGLLMQRRRRDRALAAPEQEGLDRSFIVLLWLTALTGLLLLVLRHQPVMGVLLIVHLGIVLALFLTLPYGKFVHGLYRGAALLKYRREEACKRSRRRAHERLAARAGPLAPP